MPKSFHISFLCTSKRKHKHAFVGGNREDRINTQKSYAMATDVIKYLLSLFAFLLLIVFRRFCMCFIAL